MYRRKIKICKNVYVVHGSRCLVIVFGIDARGKNAIGICARAHWCLVAALVKNSATIWAAGDSGTIARVASQTCWWRGVRARGMFTDGGLFVCRFLCRTVHTKKKTTRRLITVMAEGL